MLSSSAPVLLGLLAAATWGAADFAGGLATRRAAPGRVVFIAHGVSFLLLAAVSGWMPASLPPWAIVGGLLSGIAGGAALMLFYKALSLGAMGLSAALAGLLTAVLPVLLAIRTQGAPALLQTAGFLLAAVSIVLIAYASPEAGRAPEPVSERSHEFAPRLAPELHARSSAPNRRALLFSILAGAGFGLQLVWLHAAVAAGAPPATASGAAPASASLALVLRALLLSRLGGAGIALAALLAARARHTRGLPAPLRNLPGTQPGEPHRLALPALAALAGLLDTAGNGFYMLSSLAGRLDVAAVLASLYPGGTILLAALFLHERATRAQALGMGLALLAVALIAA